ncbi:hypothetical protein [Brevundimonas sp.]|jgi:hypothetical protein|uniref:hypothetical protein n=1 Tax=Brevundimonas sp. TaxID=1871086 RepID=UPI00391A1044
MRALSLSEQLFVSGGSRIQRDNEQQVDVDLDRDGDFDTTGTVRDGVLTTADGTTFRSYEYLPTPDYRWGAFYGHNDPGWRDSDMEALQYDLNSAVGEEAVAESVGDAITVIELVRDFFDPLTWIDLVVGNSAEQAEAEQDRLEDRIEELETQAPNP